MTKDEKMTLVHPMKNEKSTLALQFIITMGGLCIASGLISIMLSYGNVGIFLLGVGTILFLLNCILYIIFQIILLVKYKHILDKKFIKEYFIEVVLCGILESIF